MREAYFLLVFSLLREGALHDSALFVVALLSLTSLVSCLTPLVDVSFLWILASVATCLRAVFVGSVPPSQLVFGCSLLQHGDSTAFLWNFGALSAYPRLGVRLDLGSLRVLLSRLCVLSVCVLLGRNSF